MQERDQFRLASGLTILVGIWIAISPIWISMTGGLLASTIITGIIIALAGVVQYFWENSSPSWISALAAIWLFISAFGFSSATSATQWNLIISAIVVFLLAIWDGFEVTQFVQHNPHPHVR